MARIFRKTYTEKLPDGAEVFVKSGKKHARFKRNGKLVIAPLTQKGGSIIREVKKWYIDYKDENGLRQCVPGYTDRRATEQKASELERTAEHIRSGYKPKEHEQLTRPLQDHLKEYKASILNKGTTKKQAQQVYNRALRIVKECGFMMWSDFTASKIQHYLAGLRADKDEKRGISAQTSNGYLQAIKSFCQWLYKEGRTPENPLTHLQGLNVKADRRHDRRSLEPDEIRKLLEATEAAPKRFGMSGYERHLLYRFAAVTGLRANEIRTLTVGSFDFDKLTVLVKAGYSKRRREDILPLRAELAVLLKEFFKGKMAKTKAFGGTYKQLAKKTSDMIKADLKDAGIPYVDEDGRYTDFHSLRHTTGSLLAASGVHPKVAQTIMRHSDINLTMLRYTHIFRGQESEAIQKLPDLSLPSSQSQKATGTNDETLEIVPAEGITTRKTTSGKATKPNTMIDKKLDQAEIGLLNRRVSNRGTGGSNPPLSDYNI